MRQVSLGITVSAALMLLLVGAAGAAPGRPLTTCPVDAVASGGGCMDKYEASVWRVPNPTTANTELVGKIKSGMATVVDLTAGGATPLGTGSDDYAPCAESGQNCVNDIYAVSLPGVTPSASITWFQAQQACTNAGKRLPSNAEWQAAVAGTPDPGPDNGTTDCNTSSTDEVALTGSRSSCVSSRGAFDMVGNLFEWVADWVPRSTGVRQLERWRQSDGRHPVPGWCRHHGRTRGADARRSSFEGSVAGPLSVAGDTGPSGDVPWASASAAPASH